MASRKKVAPGIAAGRRLATSYQTLRAGPFRRVLTTDDPYDDDPSELMDMVNGYIPDPQGGSGCYARPGAVCQNPDGQLGLLGFRTVQAFYTHTALSGDTFNFAVCGGRLYRADAFNTLTDVTPLGTTIDPNRTTRVFCASLTGTMVVSDGVNAPWIASNLNSTPITATPISFSTAAGTNWSAYGRPEVYGGAMFFIINQVNGVSARTSIAWCEPGDPSTGYQQTNFSNYWTLEQTGTTPIYALSGTNVALYYWREGSIGSIQGEVGPNLAANATHDVISINVGALASAGVQQFGNTIFFADQLGRPWAFALGNTPTDIWKQLRAIVDGSTIGFPLVTAITTTAAIESTLNLYVAAIWSPAAAATASPTQLLVFDAKSLTYQGRWIIGGTADSAGGSVWGPDVWGADVWGSFVWGGDSPVTPSDTGISIDCVGTWQDAQGRSVLVVGGSQSPNGASGFVWTLQSVSGIPDDIAQEGGGLILQEGGGAITTEGQPAQWMDGSAGKLVTPQFSTTTNRFGYSDDVVWNFDRVTPVLSTNSPCDITTTTTAVTNTLEGVSSPVASQDGTYRPIGGLDGMQGRGMTVTIAPTDATVQRIIQSISTRAVPSLAGADEP